jgi:hypothetical protein
MSKRAPPAPDYTAAANAQAEGSRNVVEQQTWANRPDQVTPFGTQSWQSTPTVDPTTGQTLNRWTQTTQLTPDSQAALDAQLALTRGRSEIGAGMLGRVESEFGAPMDWSQFQQGGSAPQAGNLRPEQLQRNLDFSGAQQVDPSQRYAQRAEDAIYSRAMGRMQPQQEQMRAQTETRLRNQGLRPGDEAYDRQMEQLGQQQGDERERALFEAISRSGQEASRFMGMDLGLRQQQVGEIGQQGAFANQAAGLGFGQQATAGAQNFGQAMQSSNYQTQLRQQQIAEEMQRRGFSLNEINALISGQQVGMPSMPGFNSASQAQGPQLLQAAQMQGQSQLDAFNAQNAQLGNLIGAVASPFSFGFGG